MTVTQERLIRSLSVLVGDIAELLDKSDAVTLRKIIASLRGTPSVEGQIVLAILESYPGSRQE